MNKEEKREYMRLWREKNIDKIKSYQKKDYQKHRDGYLKRAKKQRDKRDKEDWKKYHQQWRDNNSEKIREYSKSTYEKNKDKFLSKKAEYIDKFPEKRLAHILLRSAVLSKKIIKPKYCQICNGTYRIEGHHPDYSKPLEVIWLCSKCHHKIHNENIINKTQ
jgi:hypothetical protein